MSVASAVVARLTQWAAAQPFLVSVYFVQVPGIPPVDPVSLAGRYLVVFPLGEPWARSTVDGASRDVSASVQVTSVAWLTGSFDSPADEVEWLQRQVKAQLVDWAPSVDGLLPGPLGHSQAGRLRADETIADRHVIYAADQFTLTADRS